jgi:NhaP-type Na+/H+ or K+/H+ antiporter
MPWAVPAIAVSILVFAAFSRRLEGTIITAPMVFTAAGLLLGASVLDALQADPSHEATKLLAESTLAVMMFGDAARINLKALRDEFHFPARLLGIGLPLTIALGFGVALLVFGSLDWPEALLLAVIVAPTDAALGQAVVTMPSLPSRIRQGLNVESGLNDGLCVPVFVTVLAIASTDAGLVGERHAIRLLIEQIGYGIVFGAVGGALTAAVIVFAAPRGYAAASWLQVVPAAGAFLCYTAAVAVDGSGFIAAFVGGLVFGALRRRIGGEVGYLLEEVGSLLGAATFVVFGAVLLEPALSDITWAVVAYAVLSLTLVRMLPVAVSLLGTHARPRTVAFVGWFGPRGLASIVFAILLIEPNGELPHEHVLLTTVFLTIGLSVLAHGVTAAPLARRYSAWYAAHPRPSRVESGEVHEVRWRVPHEIRAPMTDNRVT